MVRFDFRSFYFLSITIIEKFVQFSITSFGNAKNDYVIKTVETFSFLPGINFKLYSPIDADQALTWKRFFYVSINDDEVIK